MSSTISVNGNTDTFIKNELSKFVLEHTGQDALSAIDEIVLSYLVSILESLGSDDLCQEAFDVGEFTEMMSAYIPSFTDINSSDICEWMFQLANWLKNATKANGGNKISLEEFFCLSRYASPASENASLSSSPSSSASSSRSRSTSQSEDEEKSSNFISQRTADFNQELEILVEMFPHVCVMEIQQCFSMVDGDCEKAAQLLLQQQESGNTLLPNGVLKQVIKKGGEKKGGDKKVRQHILNRYAYIDEDDDVRDHKPVAPKAEPKKLIRYRDNKVVSIKGERFSEVKSEDGEAQKKTFINLKPARQYRFH